MLDVTQTGDAWRSLWPCGKPMLWSRLLAEPVALWKGPCWSRFSDRPWGPGVESRLELFWRTAPHGRNLHWSSSWSPEEELTLEKFLEDCLPWDGPHAGAGKMWGVLPWEGRSSRDNMWWNWLQPLHFPSPCTTGWRRERKLWGKLSSRRRESSEKVFLRFSFYFSLSYSNMDGSSLFIHGSTVWVIPACSCLTSLLLDFFSSTLALVGTCCPARVNPPHRQTTLLET